MRPASFKDLVTRNRSCRRFDNSHKLDEKTLIKRIELAMNCASGANKQPLNLIVGSW